MNRLTILGSGFAVANQDQENSYLLFESDAHKVLVDCGNNPVGKLQRIGVTINSITDLILTHAHADHMGALPLLLMDMWLQKRETPLNIYGLPFTLEKAKILLSVFDWEKWANMFPVNFHEVSDQTVQKVIESPDIQVSTGPVIHLIPTIGVRVFFPATQRTIVYSCDSQPSEELYSLADGTDLLLQEAAGPGKGHSSPSEAGANAARAGAKELVLIHYNPGKADSDQINEAKSQFNGKISMAKDLLTFE